MVDSLRPGYEIVVRRLCGGDEVVISKQGENEVNLELKMTINERLAQR